MDAIEHHKASAARPPVAREVSLPDTVSVIYLAACCGVRPITIALLINEWRICMSVDCHIDYNDAARILWKYGILAKREKSG
jgi:hypothetical protein